MTTQKVFEILEFLDALDERLKLQDTLESVHTSLSNLVSSPAHPQYQSALASALSGFEQGAAQLGGEITPSQYAVIDAMGGGEFFDPFIADKVRETVQTNAMTPSVANNFVEDLYTRRAGFLKTVRSAKQDLEKLKITASALAPGSADLAFLIPRDIFDNKLVSFAKELNFISRLLQHFSEGLTGEATPVELEQLSSSVPTVALLASLPVIGVLATIVNKFLDAWKKIEEIRQMRTKLMQMGLKKTALDELTEQVDTTINEVVEEATVLVLTNYKGSAERKSELSNAVSLETHRLFGQIERGLKVEFRSQPDKDASPEEQKALTNISDLARTMQFPEIAPEPMLLKSGEILEGEIQAVKQSKKTTTQKTTVSKRAVVPAEE